MGKALGFDLGSAYTALCFQDEKDIKMMASVIALGKSEKLIKASGNEAKTMIGRVPNTVTIERPIKCGYVDDITTAALLITEILKKTETASVFKKTEAVATIPYRATKNDERALYAAFEESGINTLDFVETPLAIALGAGMPTDMSKGIMVVDAGAGQIDSSIISHGGVVSSCGTSVAGDAMTEAVAKYIADAHGIEVGELTAELVKIKIGTLLHSSPQKSVRVGGKVVAGKGSMHGNKFTSTATISSHELIPVLTPFADKIVDRIAATLDGTPPDIASDISDFGILLSGGCAALPGLSTYIEKALKIKVTTTKAPAYDAIRGVLRIVNGGRAYAKFTK